MIQSVKQLIFVMVPPMGVTDLSLSDNNPLSR